MLSRETRRSRDKTSIRLWVITSFLDGHPEERWDKREGEEANVTSVGYCVVACERNIGVNLTSKSTGLWPGGSANRSVKVPKM